MIRYISGTYCTKLFADFGANVMKEEKERKGDPSRGIVRFLNDEHHQDKSALFYHFNTNKKSIISC